MVTNAICSRKTKHRITSVIECISLVKKGACFWAYWMFFHAVVVWFVNPGVAVVFEETADTFHPKQVNLKHVAQGPFPLSNCDCDCDCDRFIAKRVTFPTEQLRLRLACYFLLWNRNCQNGSRTHCCDCDCDVAMAMAIASGKGYYVTYRTHSCDVAIAIAEWERALRLSTWTKCLNLLFLSFRAGL